MAHYQRRFMMKTLAIKLAAPLQSYGDEATFSRRTTSDYPTKSAVIGMIAAALGYRRTDARIESLNALNFAVRIDQVGKVLTDFHTVEWKKGTRKITYRDYLQDAVFIVAVGSENIQLIDEVCFALKHPRFQLFLGRRANVPAGYLEVHEFLEMNPVATLAQLAWQAAPWYQRKFRQETLEVIADSDLIGESQSVMVRERVISFDQRNRQYGFRAIARTRIKLSGLQMTDHDAVGSL